jgi:hypothetical protein
MRLITPIVTNRMTSGSIEVTPSWEFVQFVSLCLSEVTRVQPKTLITPIVTNRMTSGSIEVTPFVGIRAIRVCLPLRGYPRSAQDTNYTNCHESDDIEIN